MNIEDKLYKLRLLQEQVVSSQDPVHYLANHARIPSIGLGKHFELYEHQKEYMSALTSDRFVICKGDRQTGLSISTLMYIFWYAMHHENKNIFILSNTSYGAEDSLNKIRFAYENLPVSLRNGIEYAENRKSKCRFANGTRIIATSNPHAMRGATLDLVHVDNFELIKPYTQDELWMSMVPAILSNKESKIIITSSSAGAGTKLFNRLFREGAVGKNRFTPITLRLPDMLIPTNDLTGLELNI